MSNEDVASGRFLLRLSPGLHAVLRGEAAAAGVSLNELCVRKLGAPGPMDARAAAVLRRAEAVAGDALEALVVFGSWARGEATASSDVDVLLVLREALPVRRALYRRWDEEPVTWEGRSVEPHFVRMPAEDETPSGLWAEVSVDGVVLYDRAFELSRRLARIRARVAEGALVRRGAPGQRYWVAA